MMQRFVYISLALCSGLAVFLYSSSGIGQPQPRHRFFKGSRAKSASLFLGFVIQRLLAPRSGRISKPNRRYLSVYLNDHLAGSIVGLELLVALEKTHAEIAPALAALRVDIEQDQTELKALMDRLNIAESGVRKIGGWLIEKTTQLKMRIDDRPGGVLHLFESLEALSLGIEGKLALWRTLKALADLSPDLACSDYERLMKRAIEQRSRAEALRLQSAITALRPT